MALITVSSRGRPSWSIARLFLTLLTGLTPTAALATTLPTALDQPGLTITGSGNQPWAFQSDISRTGLDAAGSGPIGDSQQSVMETIIDGPGTVSFWQKVSSQDGADTLSFSIDGTPQGTPISGEVDWEQQSFTLAAGSHTLRWTYAKDGSTSEGEDTAWIDQLQIPVQRPPAIITSPEPATIVTGRSAAMSVSASGGALNYQWYEGQSGDATNPVPGATGPILITLPLRTGSSFWVRVSNVAGTVSSSAAAVTMTSPTPTRLTATGFNSHGQLGDGTTTDRNEWFVTATDVIDMSAGDSHSLLVKSDGSLWAMGNNESGQLGDGTNVDRNTPARVANGVTAASAGTNHSLFLKSDHTLWASGGNEFGQLGDNTNNDRTTPVQVASDVTAVSAGRNHTLFLKSNGTLWASGYNQFGQLGDGTTINRHTPIQIAEDVIQMTAGNYFSQFVRADGTLWAMGDNGDNQLGDGTATDQHTPVLVATGVATTASGSLHSLFLKTDGSLWAVGKNTAGQLGSGTTTSTALPVKVAEDVVMTTAGNYFSFFQKADGTLWAMGSNTYGQLGTGSIGSNHSTPIRIAGSINAVSAGGHFALARDPIPEITANPMTQGAPAGGTVTFTVTATGATPINYQWFQGESGDVTNPMAGATSPSFTSPPVTETIPYWVRVSTSYGQRDSLAALAVLLTPPLITAQPTPQEIELGKNAALQAIVSGDLLSYQWFTGATGNTASPIDGATGPLVLTPPVRTDLSLWVRVSNAAGTVDSQAATVTARLPLATRMLGVGQNGVGQLGDSTKEPRPDPVVVGTQITSVVAGKAHTLFTKNDRTLWATGGGYYGQLGNGTTDSTDSPIMIAENVIATAVGEHHSLFIKDDHSLWAMGDNGSGRLGDGTTAHRLTPVEVATDVVAAAAGYHHSLFIKSDGSLWGMGSNFTGQLGDESGDSKFSPARIEVDGIVVAIAAGQQSSFFITAEGSLYAMGLNHVGQLGDGTNTDRARPVLISKDVIAVKIRYFHTLFIKSDHTCWGMGDNSDGQLGDGTTDSHNVPVLIANDVMAIAAGETHSHFITTDRILRAMGNNNSSQLGDGTTSSHLTPVQVATVAHDVATGEHHTLIRDLVPAIVQQPIGVGAPTGDTPSLSVSATSLPPFTYQWYEGVTGDTSSPAAGATAETFTAPPVTADTSFWVRVSNPYGSSDSTSAFVSIVTTPVIDSGPVAQSFGRGENTFLTVTASGGHLSYQWFRGQSGNTSSPVAGTTKPRLVTPPLHRNSSYWLRVTNAAGTTDSPTLELVPEALATNLLTAGGNSSGQLGESTLSHHSPRRFTHTGIVATAAGDSHSLLLKADQTLWTTGSNSTGQLGNGSTHNRALPLEIAEDVVSIAAGFQHSLFVTVDGSLWAMGSNSAGQLGDGTTTVRPTPVEVASDVVTCVAGKHHSLFIKSDGALWAMGSNADGQLGDATTINRTLPIKVAENVATAAAGYSHSAFIKTDGTLWTMGANGAGRLGDGSKTERNFPVQVAEQVAQVATGALHTLFVKMDGTLWAAGENYYGRLGDGTTIDRSTPVHIADDVLRTAAGSQHSFFIKIDRSLWAMGKSSAGQLGVSIAGFSRSTPFQVQDGVITVSSGSSHTLIRSLTPEIASQPLDVGAPAGNTALLEIKAVGQAPLSYQWFQGISGNTSTPIPGAEASTLTITPTAGSPEHWVRVTNADGSIDSRTALVEIVTPPIITLEPVPADTSNGGSAALKVAATGGYLAYQWFEGASGDTSSPVPGALGPMLVTRPLSSDTSYWVRASNAAGIADSAAASVTIVAPSAGRLLAMGEGDHGELANERSAASTVPILATTGVTAVAAGYEHTLFVRSDQSLWACGNTAIGALGDGNTDGSRFVPAQVATDVQAVAAGLYSSLFLKTDGTLWAMGVIPRQISADVRKIAAGSSHRLFIKTDGTLWAMGSNYHGQLGDGSTTYREVPVMVAEDVAVVSAGSDHSMFIKTDGSLWAMGNNNFGQLGDGSRSSQSLPVQIAEHVSQVSCGWDHSLIVKTDGTLWSVGYNSYGALGTGATTRRYVPALVAEDVIDVATGDYHSFFIKSDHSLWGMGRASSGQLGDGSTSDRKTPIRITDAVFAAAGGRDHSLFLDLLPFVSEEPQDERTLTGGRPTLSVTAGGKGPFSYQWYRGISGNTNNPVAGATDASYTVPHASSTANYWVQVTTALGTVDSRSAELAAVTSPVITEGPSPQVIPPGEHAFLQVIATGGPSDYQWFEGSSGNTVNPVAGATGPFLLTPPLRAATSFWVRITNPAGTVDSASAAVTIGSPPPGRLLRSGRLDDGTGQNHLSPTMVDFDVIAATIGGGHTLMIKSDHSLWAMGDNSSGQVGDGGMTTTHYSPVHVADDAVQIAAGDSHSLFIKEDGTLWGMGQNWLGQLGDGTLTDQPTPVQVAEDVMNVAAGSSHSLFIKSDRTLWTMGSNYSGQLGDGTNDTRSTPVQVATDVVAISASLWHSLFVTADGTLWAMGYNSGQLGTGSTSKQLHPIMVDHNVATVAAGRGHTLILKTDGSLWSVGSNSSGQLGDGTTNSRYRPVHVADGVASIAAGTFHSLFVKGDRSLWTMGYNRYGGLGDGSTTDRSSPVMIATSVASISGGTTNSLFVDLLPAITDQPQDAGAPAGGTAILSVVARGPEPLTYQWYAGASGHTASPLAGETSTSLTTPPVTKLAGYWVRVSNPHGSADSRTGIVSTVTAPLITAGPPAQSIAADGHATLSVSATGGSLNYQWFEGQVGDTSAPVPGATGSHLVTPPLPTDTSFWVRITNVAGSVDSQAANITTTARTPANLRTVGDNTRGQLGRGQDRSEHLPTAVAENVASVSARNDHLLILKTDATLWATGNNHFGQLGDGTTIDRSTPIQVASNVISMAAGLDHNVFITADNKLWAMGNHYDETPIQIASAVVMAGAGYQETSYLTTEGVLWHRGSQGSENIVSTDVTALAQGQSHLLYLKSDRTLWGIGQNRYGQLGTGSTRTASGPVQIADEVAWIAANKYYSLFVRTDGSLWGMGGNESGRLGLEPEIGQQTIPAFIAANVARATCGEQHSLFVDQSGRPWAMGRNADRQLGDGTTLDRHVPKMITDLPPAIDEACSADSSLLVDAHGILWSIGSTALAQIGLPEVADTSTPTHVAGDITQIAAGGSHALWVISNGTLMAAGANDHGQLGDGTTLTRPAPVPIANEVTAASAGSQHSLFLKTDGTLWAMGSNARGQLGDGTTTDRSAPIQVADDVIAMAVGFSHSLFLKADLTLWSMGSNDDGQLGDSTTTDRSSPVRVAENVTSITAGEAHSLFVKTDGSLWGMGSNSHGQLGDGTAERHFQPIKVADSVSVAAAGGHHSLFLTAARTLHGIGANGAGQLGDGTTTDRGAPAQVADDVTHIAAGENHSMFLKADGTLWSVGENTSSQLGDGTAINQPTPVQIAGQVTAIAGGHAHSMFLTATPGSLATAIARHPTSTFVTPGASATLSVAAVGVPPLTYQWFAGISGDGTQPVSGATSPELTIPSAGTNAAYWVQVTSPSGAANSRSAVVTELAPPTILAQPEPATTIHGGHTLLSVQASPSTFDYQWFEGNSGDDSRPVPGATGPTFVTPRRTTTTSYWVQLRNPTGTVHSSAVEVTIPAATGYALQRVGDGLPPTHWANSVCMASSGLGHSLFITTDGTLWAVGDNSNGQLGDGTTINRVDPVAIATDVVEATAGGSHSLFVKRNETLWAMGSNADGQLGDGTTTDRLLPVQIATNVTSASAGGIHSLFVRTNGTLWGMGSNQKRQLGATTSDTFPAPIPLADSVAKVTTGWFHSLFIKTDGTLWVTGRNNGGQLGTGETITPWTPVQVAEGVVDVTTSRFEQLDNDEQHSLFLKADGSLWGMGCNTYGQLNSDSRHPSFERYAFIPTYLASGVQMAAAGLHHSMFIRTDGTLWAMGRNTNRQLGDGTTTNRPVAVQVAEHAGFVAAGPANSLILTAAAAGNPPAITSHPASISIPADQATTLSVIAIGDQPLDYQWFEGQSGDASHPVDGATSATFDTPPLATNTSFWVRVRNATSFTDSRSATVTVITATPGYLAWSQGHDLTGTNLSPNADADRDGKSNLLEYTTGGNPTIAEATSPLALSYDPQSGRAEIQLQLRGDPELTLALEFSPDIITWLPSPLAFVNNQWTSTDPEMLITSAVLGEDNLWTLMLRKAASNRTFVRLAASLGTADPTLSYLDWAQSFGLSGPDLLTTADPDRDGLPNLIEFGLNTNPLSNSAHQQPTGGVILNPGGHSVTITHRRIACTGLAFSYQTSTNLMDWSDITPTVEIVDTDGDGSNELVRAIHPVAAGQATAYLRLVVTAP